VVASAGMAARARGLTAAPSRVRALLMDDETPGDAIGYEPALAAASPALERHRCEPDAVCLQPYTSGSTGKPKGVLLTHAGQVWNSDVMRRAFAIDQRERGLVAVPLYHKNAMTGTVKPFLLAGGSFVVLNGFDAVRVIEAIERHQVTYMTGVSAMLKMVLAAHDALDRHDVSTIRYAVCGSVEVPDELFAEFEHVFGAPNGGKLRSDGGRPGAARQSAAGGAQAGELWPGVRWLRRAAGRGGRGHRRGCRRTG